MKAQIVGINTQKGRAIALTEDSEYVLLEIESGDEFEMYDEINANFNFHPLGGECVKNLNSGETIDVYIQDYCNKDLALKYLKALE